MQALEREQARNDDWDAANTRLDIFLPPHSPGKPHRVQDLLRC
jgi:hypothetical protein